MPPLNHKLYIWDTGTTGTNPNEHALHSLGCIEYSTPPQHFAAHIKPWNSRHATPAPPFVHVYNQLCDFIADTCPPHCTPLLVAHNSAFDAAFLAAELDRARLPYPPWRFACSLKLAVELVSVEDYSLEGLARRLGVVPVREHYASDDVCVLREVLREIEGWVGGDLEEVLCRRAGFLGGWGWGGIDALKVAIESGGEEKSGRYVVTRTGRYYHMVETCGSLRGAKKLIWMDVVESRLRPCWRCVTERPRRLSCGYQASTVTMEGASWARWEDESGVVTARHAATRYDLNVRPVDAGEGDVGGDMYIVTKTGKYYHMDEKCSSLRFAKKLIRTSVVEPHLSACWKCVTAKPKTSPNEHTSSTVTAEDERRASLEDDSTVLTARCDASRYDSNERRVGVGEGDGGGEMFIVTRTGQYYHMDETCSSLRLAKKLIRTAVAEPHLSPCWKCVTEKPKRLPYITSTVTTEDAASRKWEDESPVATACHAATRTNSNIGPVDAQGSEDESGMYITTRSGKYYHLDESCSSLRRAARLIHTSTVAAHLRPCWKCVGEEQKAHEPVRAQHDDGYSRSSRSDAVSMAKRRDTYSRTSQSQDEGRTMSTTSGNAKRSERYVITRSGKHYHCEEDCVGLSRATEKIRCRELPRHLQACSRCCDDVEKGYVTKEQTLEGYGVAYKTAWGKKFHTDRGCKHLMGKDVLECEPVEERKEPCRTCSVGLFQTWEIHGLTNKV